jgi:hypothetical protein
MSTMRRRPPGFSTRARFGNDARRIDDEMQHEREHGRVEQCVVDR